MIAGIVMAVLGVIGTVYTFMTVNADKTTGFQRYTYQPPFSEHETRIIILGIISIVLLIIGLIKIYKNYKNP